MNSALLKNEFGTSRGQAIQNHLESGNLCHFNGKIYRKNHHKILFLKFLEDLARI